MLRESWTCQTPANVGTLKNARLQLQPHASACRVYSARKLDLSNTSRRRHYGKCQVATATACLSKPQLCCEKAGLCQTKASVGTMRSARLQLQPHASACRSYAARKLVLSNTSQRRHYEKCQVAAATACLGMPQLCCEKAGLVTCQTQASVGTMESARLQLQPHASACRPQLCCEKA